MTVQTKARQQSAGRVQEGVTQPLQRGIALGRNGEEIRRIRTNGNDPF
jgi:hypothetical protein